MRIHRLMKTGGVAAAALALTVTAACSGVSAGSTTMQIATPNTPTDSSSLIIKWWIDQVDKASPGDINAEVKYAGALLPGNETRAGVGEGRAEGGQIIPSYHNAEMPLANVTSVPVPYDNEVIAKAYDKLIKENDDVAAEYSDAGLVPLYVGVTSSWMLATKKPVKGVDDLDGLKLRILPPAVAAYEQFGVEPLFVASDESYESLERGVIDGMSSVINVLTSVGVQEVAPHFVIDGIGNYTVWVFAVNKDWFESLPEDQQDAMRTASENAIEEGSSIVAKTEAESCKELLDGGATVTEFSDADQAKVRKAAEVLVDTFYTNGEKEGGIERSELKSVWDEYNSYLKEFEPTSTWESGVIACL